MLTQNFSKFTVPIIKATIIKAVLKKQLVNSFSFDIRKTFGSEAVV